jgi:S1 RNA binding domain protein
MQLEVGEILEGKVTGITKFGAFVELPGGKTGMVHISEIAPTFVKEIRDYVSEGQVVKVKVINILEDGKIRPSVDEKGRPRPRGAGLSRCRGATATNGRRRRSNENMSFEDMDVIKSQSSRARRRCRISQEVHRPETRQCFERPGPK